MINLLLCFFLSMVSILSFANHKVHETNFNNKNLHIEDRNNNVVDVQSMAFDVNSKENGDFEKYTKAVEYIADNYAVKNKEYIVADSTYNLDRWVFSSSLTGMPEKELIDSYTKRHQFDYETRGEYKNLQSLSKNTKSPDYIIFFSNVEDNMIVANVFLITKNNRSWNYKALAQFNSSINYLFIYGDGAEIEHVITREVQYN